LIAGPLSAIVVQTPLRVKQAVKGAMIETQW